MPKNKEILEKVLDELAILRWVPFAELATAVAAGKGFYGEGDIPLPKKDG